MTLRQGRLPPGTAVVVDRRTRLWPAGPRVPTRIALGGAPWGLVRLGPVAADFLASVIAAGPRGRVPVSEREREAADRLVGRGLVHPLAGESTKDQGLRIEVIVPVYGRPALLDRCLASLTGCSVVVVDDASPHAAVAEVARSHGSRLIRHDTNRGPAAARNTGLAHTTAPLVAFLDADCVAPPGWTDRLAGHFLDPRVAAVAPRVVPHPGSSGLLARHEASRSALDMGPEPALVRPGAPLSFLPSAALLVRRQALHGQGFDEDLRLGEDVDLVWRLAGAGWHVRYDPEILIHHELRERPLAWAGRRYEYGTSAADLTARHPGRLAPVRVSAWNLTALAALTARRPGPAAAALGTATLLLARRLRRDGVDARLAAVVVGKGVLSDAVALGHALRREWWPLGWISLALSGRSRTARAAALAALAPVALEWLRRPPAVDPVRYAALRLAEDAAYGTGVIAGAWRRSRPEVLVPRIRFTGPPRRTPPRT